MLAGLGAESLDGSAGPKKFSPPDLTERELEVCRLIALGYSTREAAEELGVSTRTVDGYRARLNEKLGFQSRRDLVAFALKHRIIS